MASNLIASSLGRKVLVRLTAPGSAARPALGDQPPRPRAVDDDLYHKVGGPRMPPVCSLMAGFVCCSQLGGFGLLPPLDGGLWRWRRDALDLENAGIAFSDLDTLHG